MAFLACGGASDSVHRQCGGHSCLATETGTMAFLASGGASVSVFDSGMDTPVWHQRPFTPPICSEPPVDTSTRICWSRQRCRQFQLRWLMRRPVSKSHSLFTVLTCHLLPKEFDDKVAKMHLSALGAELVALIVDVSPAGTSPKAVCGASCERFCGESIQEVQGTMEVPQGQYIDRITDATVCCNTKYDPSEQCTSRQHSRRLRLSQRQSSMFQKDSRDPPSAVH